MAPAEEGRRALGTQGIGRHHRLAGLIGKALAPVGTGQAGKHVWIFEAEANGAVLGDLDSGRSWRTRLVAPAVGLDEQNHVRSRHPGRLPCSRSSEKKSTIVTKENITMKTGNGARPITRVAMLSAAVFIGGCASTPPTKIGGDTYYSSKTNTAGIFGDVSAVSGKLMVEGNQFCASMDKEFELVTQTTTSNIPGVRLGGASITFRCVVHANDVHMRPDNGVTTTTTQ